MSCMVWSLGSPQCPCWCHKTPVGWQAWSPNSRDQPQCLSSPEEKKEVIKYIHYNHIYPHKKSNKQNYRSFRQTLTDSLSEAEESRDLPLLVLQNCPDISEDWLVTVERRVDIKLLWNEWRSRLGTHNSTRRHGMYFAMANLTDTDEIQG